METITYIAHYGLKGMHWGERRWQYEDGRFNEAGKIRYFGYPKGRNRARSHEPIKTTSHKQAGESSTSKRQIDENLTKSTKDSNNTRSPKTLSECSTDTERKEHLKKALIGTAAVVGVTGAVYLCYRYNAIDKLKRLAKEENIPLKDVAKSPKAEHVMEMAAKETFAAAAETPGIKELIIHDMHEMQAQLSKTASADTIIKPGAVLKRIDARETTELSKYAGRGMYTAFTEADAAAYAVFLKDYTKTGKRDQLDLKVLKEIRIPSDETAKSIFYELWNSNPNYRKAVEDSYVALISKNLPWTARKEIRDQVRYLIGDDPFHAGITTLTKGSNDYTMLKEAFTKKGYTGIKDYHDIFDQLSEMPLILFEGNNQVEISGRRMLTTELQEQAKEFLYKVKDHPAKMWLPIR